MLETRRAKNDETPAERRDVAALTACCVDAQGPAVRRLPGGIQIERERHLALFTALRLIDVPGEERTGIVPGVMQLEIEQAEGRLAIERESQALHAVEQA